MESVIQEAHHFNQRLQNLVNTKFRQLGESNSNLDECLVSSIEELKPQTGPRLVHKPLPVRIISPQEYTQILRTADPPIDPVEWGDAPENLPTSVYSLMEHLSKNLESGCVPDSYIICSHIFVESFSV